MRIDKILTLFKCENMREAMPVFEDNNTQHAILNIWYCLGNVINAKIYLTETQALLLNYYVWTKSDGEPF